MIRFNYDLKRDEGNGMVTYAPNIPKELPNLVYIEGPNSSGKSTLLNILAAGFHAEHRKGLNPALKEKVRAILESEHQEITFSFQVESPDKRVRLVAEKKDPRSSEIVLREFRDGNARLLGPEAFHREYNLVYDIPDNPTERLFQLLDEIRRTQSDYANRLSTLRSAIRGIQLEIQSGRDPRRISSLEQTINEQTREIEQISDTLRESEDVFSALERLTAVRSLIDYVERLQSVERRLADIAETKGQKDRKVRRVAKKTAERIREATAYTQRLKELKFEITPALRTQFSKKDKHRMDAWNDINFDDINRDHQIPPAVPRLIADLKKSLSDVGQDKDFQEKLTRVRIYEELADLLRKYEGLNVNVPGTNKTFQQLINAIEDENKANKQVAQAAKNIERAEKGLTEISAILPKLQTCFKEISKDRGGEAESEEVFVDDSQAERELETLNREKPSLDENVRFWFGECGRLRIGIDDLDESLRTVETPDEVRPFLTYSSTELLDAKKAWSDNITRDRKKIHDGDRARAISIAELNRLKEKKPHKFQDRVDDLQRLYAACYSMEQRLTKDFESFVVALTDRNRPSGAPNDVERYLSAVGKYLAKRIGHIRHVSESYVVADVDILRGRVITSSGKRILFSDMGTGQSQSAYLTGLLNSDDDRTIIALFDEVAMMDTHSLKPIYERLSQLHESNRLLVGLVVQMADALKVEPITKRTGRVG